VGVGVRVKKIGPIKAKVYSAGFYCNKLAAIASLKKLKQKNNEEVSQSVSINNYD
jgi:hypothetical protein